MALHVYTFLLWQACVCAFLRKKSHTRFFDVVHESTKKHGTAGPLDRQKPLLSLEAKEVFLSFFTRCNEKNGIVPVFDNINKMLK